MHVQTRRRTSFVVFRREKRLTWWHYLPSRVSAFLISEPVNCEPKVSLDSAFTAPLGPPRLKWRNPAGETCSAPRLHKTNVVESRSHPQRRSPRTPHFQESAGSPSAFEPRSRSATFQPRSLRLKRSRRGSGGSTAQPLQLRRVPPARPRGQVRTGSRQPSVQAEGADQTRVASLAVHVIVGADLLGGCRACTACAGAVVSAPGSETSGLSKLAFPAFNVLCGATARLQLCSRARSQSRIQPCAAATSAEVYWDGGS